MDYYYDTVGLNFERKKKKPIKLTPPSYAAGGDPAPFSE